ncbi:hypothetical protein PYCC9005_000450 [Savitreella phatthalungensis]
MDLEDTAGKATSSKSAEAAAAAGAAASTATAHAAQVEADDEPVVLRVRFASAIVSDLVHALTPGLTAGDLKDAVRAARPADTKGRILRLIYLGKILGDPVQLTDVCRPPPRTALRASDAAPATGPSTTGKGKARVKAREVVLQCSIGALIADLAKEAQARRATESATASAGSTQAGTPAGQATPQPGLANGNTTTPAPRGFDRLRAAGLAEEEIASLREQFRRGSSRLFPGGLATQDAESSGVASDSSAMPSDVVSAIEQHSWAAMYGVELAVNAGDAQATRERQLQAEEEWIDDEAGPGGGLLPAQPRPRETPGDVGRLPTRQYAGNTYEALLQEPSTMARGIQTARSFGQRIGLLSAADSEGAAATHAADSFSQAYYAIIGATSAGFFLNGLALFFLLEADTAARAAGGVSSFLVSNLSPGGSSSVASGGAGYNGWRGSILVSRSVKVCIWVGILLNILFGFCRE